MIQIENTPNPNALKFLSENTISEIGTIEFQKNNISEIKNNFVKNLLNIEGIELILLSDNFLSVKKLEQASWENIKPSVISHLNDYYEKNQGPILNESLKNESNEQSEVIKQIKDVEDTRKKNIFLRTHGNFWSKKEKLM